MAVEEPILDTEEEEEEEGLFRRSRGLLIAFFILFAAGIPLAIKLVHSSGGPTKKADNISMVKLLPLPPPPPPPPPPPQQQEPVKQDDKMVAEDHPDSSKPKPDEKPAPKAPAPAGPLGTGIKGNGPDSFGLGASGDGGGFFGNGGGTGATSKWGWYAGEVQSKIADALRKDPRTRDAALRIQVRIWADLTGRIMRAKVEGTTGNLQLDDALQSQILTGMQLQEPPPDGMPMPIVLRLTAVRPD